MFSCSDGHQKIQHEEYSCPLCEALDDVQFLKGQLMSEGEVQLRSQVSLEKRIKEGCC